MPFVYFPADFLLSSLAKATGSLAIAASKTLVQSSPAFEPPTLIAKEDRASLYLGSSSSQDDPLSSSFLSQPLLRARFVFFSKSFLSIVSFCSLFKGMYVPSSFLYLMPFIHKMNS